MLTRWFGAATWPVAGWLLLLQLLLLQVCSGSAQQRPATSTAYLVDSMEQSFQASNSSFNNLRLILSQLDKYNTIVLTEDYAIDNSHDYTLYPVRLPQDLLITSAPGQLYQMSFSFLVRPEVKSSWGELRFVCSCSCACLSPPQLDQSGGWY
jgi:hypothetical protein